MTRRALMLSCVVAILLAGPAHAAAPKTLEPLSFLLGEWIAGPNEGEHGQGTGSTSFTPGLQDQVIVRTNHAEYPASEKSAAVKHDDLMVIYATDAGAQASYYDNEGHFIHYSIATPGPSQAVFLGDAVAGAPRYRLTYRLRPDGVLEGEFEIAPPGKPDAFARYLVWECRRAAGGR